MIKESNEVIRKYAEEEAKKAGDEKRRLIDERNAWCRENPAQCSDGIPDNATIVLEVLDEKMVSKELYVGCP